MNSQRFLQLCDLYLDLPSYRSIFFLEGNGLYYLICPTVQVAMKHQPRVDSKLNVELDIFFFTI